MGSVEKRSRKSRCPLPNRSVKVDSFCLASKAPAAKCQLVNLWKSRQIEIVKTEQYYDDVNSVGSSTGSTSTEETTWKTWIDDDTVQATTASTVAKSGMIGVNHTIVPDHSNGFGDPKTNGHGMKLSHGLGPVGETKTNGVSVLITKTEELNGKEHSEVSEGSSKVSSLSSSNGLSNKHKISPEKESNSNEPRRKKVKVVCKFSDEPLTDKQAKTIRMMVQICTPYDDPALDMAKLKEGMRRTFEIRRTWIVDKMPAILTILRGFPALGTKPILKFEYELMANHPYKTIHKTLQPLLDKALEPKLAKRIGDKYSACKKALQVLQRSSLPPSSKKYKELRNSVALYILWYKLVPKIKESGLFVEYLVKEKAAAAACNQNNYGVVSPWTKKFPNTPCFLIIKGRLFDDKGADTELVIYAEQNDMVHCSNFYKCMIMIYLIYSAFSLRYDTNVKQLFEHFDKVLGNKFA